MIEPTESTQNEYVPFTIQYTISSIEIDQPVLSHVTVTSGDGRDYSSDLNIVLIDDQHFSISGELNDVFDREMKYLDKYASPGIKTRWKDIPSGFQTLYSYKGAAINSITLTVTAHNDIEDETSIITISNNFALANSKLTDYVNRGQY